MQSLARSMLQELQLQGASDAGAACRGGRAPGAGAQEGDGGGGGRGCGRGCGGGGGRGATPGSPGESETSFPFPSADLSPTTRSSSLFFEDSGAPRESPHDTTRRDRGDEVETGSHVIRSGVGQRPPSPPSCASTLETIEPQLLAKSSWVDANVPLPTPDSVAKYRTVQKASTTAHILTLLSSNPTPLLLELPSPLQLISEVPLPAELPIQLLASNESKHSTSSHSTTASKASTASSFAYQMRHNGPDLRLMRQKSKPLQHTIQKPSILKIPGDIKRSPTFFKPKVVSDTAIVIMGKASNPTLVPQPPIPPAFPEMLRAESFINSPICRVKTHAIPVSKRLPPLPLAGTEERLQAGGHQSTTSAKDFAHVRSVAAPDPVARQLRFENPVATARHNNESPAPSAGRSQKSSTEKSRRSSTSAQTTPHRHKKQYHAVTPPEEEPHVTPLHHGDSYFQTFHTLPDATSKEFVPVQTPQAQDLPKKADVLRRRPDSELEALGNTRPLILATHSKDASETAAAPVVKIAKPSNIFGFFFRRQTREFDKEEFRNHATTPESTMVLPATPGILLNASDEVSGKRRMSSVVPEMQMQSYFNRPRVRRLPSDSSLSPTGLATPSILTQDEPPSPVPGKGRARYQNRSSSDQLSPVGTPRARHRPTLESLRSRISQTTMKSTPASETEMRRVPTNKSDKKSSVKTTAKGSRKDSVKFVDQTDIARTDIGALDRNQVTLKSKPSNYFVDIRKVSSAGQPSYEDGSPPETKGVRRWSLLPKLSSMSLSRISLSHLSSFAAQKLHRKSSQLSSLEQSSSSGGTELESDPSPPHTPVIKGGVQPSIPVGRRFSAAQLEVTEFEQTPFSQRYHDSERSLQQKIRTLVDEALNEADDAEGDNELVLGFEQGVPDHFTTSPLCPLHPKHKSGGKAICPLHGRYRKGMPPPVPPAGKKPVGRVSSSGIDPHARHHRIEIVLDTAIVGEPSVKEGKAAPVDIFGGVKEDHYITNKGSILGTDGAVSVRNRATPLYLVQADSCRGRKRERDLCGSERKRRRRARMSRA